MIQKVWRATARALGSAVLATWLLAALGLWAMVASVIPQSSESPGKVAVWASAHPLAEPLVRVLGLHEAFTAPFFIACAVALGVCTAFCAWQRTRMAIGKARALRAASETGMLSLGESHDFEVVCDPSLSSQQALEIAARTLRTLGIKAKRRDAGLSMVSRTWSVGGSPVFHWALLLLIVVILGGNLVRSEGLMGVAVGQTKMDAAASYGVWHAGPWQALNASHRSIRVDAFDPDYQTGGIDRGPTPTVSVLDSSGHVLKSQRVYPNMTLKTGALTVYPNDYGLSVAVTLLNSAGAETGHQVELVDFSPTATGGTSGVSSLKVNDNTGELLFGVAVSVPLDRKGGTPVDELPKDPTARVVVVSPDGTPVMDRVIRPGEELVLPDGDSLRVDAVNYYARLSVVDDGSIPLIYAGLLIALLGLSMTAIASQQVILVAAVEEPEGVKLVARVRLWRNSSSSRDEIEIALAHALGTVDVGNRVSPS